MNLKEMQSALSLDSIPSAFEEIFSRIGQTWEARAAHILSETCIRTTLTDCYAMLPYLDTVCDAAACIQKNPALCLLVCLLEQWIADGVSPAFPEYTPPSGEGLEYDFLHLFPAISTMPNSVKFFRDRQLPEDIIAASMREYDDSVATSLLQQGRPVFDKGRLAWLVLATRNHIMRLGRLKFDMPDLYMEKVRVYENETGEQIILADGIQVHRSGRVLGSVGHTDTDGSFLAEITETEDTVTGYPAIREFVQNTPVTLSKSQWTLRLCAQDPVIRMHIPRDESFDPEIVERSYAQAREIFARHFPDYPYKAFFCNSWLMSQELPSILKPTSNILAFQNKFTIVPSISVGRAVFSFVFLREAQIPDSLDDLPQNTSLERSIVQVYRQGGYIHEGSGFFF